MLREQDIPQRRRTAHGETLLAALDDSRAIQVLDYVLALHPERHLTIPALVEAVLDKDSPDFGCGSELECAIRDYVSEGVLRLNAGEVWPTRSDH